MSNTPWLSVGGFCPAFDDDDEALEAKGGAQVRLAALRYTKTWGKLPEHNI